MHLGVNWLYKTIILSYLKIECRKKAMLNEKIFSKAFCEGMAVNPKKRLKTENRKFSTCMFRIFPFSLWIH